MTPEPLPCWIRTAAGIPLVGPPLLYFTASVPQERTWQHAKCNTSKPELHPLCADLLLLPMPKALPGDGSQYHRLLLM